MHGRQAVDGLGGRHLRTTGTPAPGGAEQRHRRDPWHGLRRPPRRLRGRQGLVDRVLGVVDRAASELGEDVGSQLEVDVVGRGRQQRPGDGGLADPPRRPGQLDPQPAPVGTAHERHRGVAPAGQPLEELPRGVAAVAERRTPVQQPTRGGDPGTGVGRRVERQLGEGGGQVGPAPAQRGRGPYERQSGRPVDDPIGPFRPCGVHVASRPAVAHHGDRTAWPTVRPLRSVTGQLTVRDPVRTRRLRAEPLDLVLLVRLEVALEPEPARRVLVRRPPTRGCG